MLERYSPEEVAELVSVVQRAAGSLVKQGKLPPGLDGDDLVSQFFADDLMYIVGRFREGRGTTLSKYLFHCARMRMLDYIGRWIKKLGFNCLPIDDSAVGRARDPAEQLASMEGIRRIIGENEDLHSFLAHAQRIDRKRRSQENRQKIIKLFKVGHRNAREIADLLDLPIKSVENVIFTARKEGKVGYLNKAKRKSLKKRMAA